MEGTCLHELENILDIEIPNSVVAFMLFIAYEDIVNGGSFIDTDDDSRGVEEKEHHNGGNKNQGMIGICLLMFQPDFDVVSC